MTFNADEFLSQTTDAAMQDKMVLVPEGEFIAAIGDGPNDLNAETFQGTKDPTKTFVRLTIFWNILDEQVKKTLGRESVRVRQQFILDMEDGRLGTGPDQNVRLGAIRTALGLNSPGMAFSIGMLRGKGPARVKVKHRPDEKDNSIKYAEVTRVSPMSA